MAEERVLSAFRALPNESLPVRLGEGAVDQRPELLELQVALRAHTFPEVVANLAAAVRGPRNDLRGPVDRLSEHVVVRLVSLHPFV